MEILQLVYLALFAIGLFATLTILRKWADSFVTIAFAIGCICGANIFTVNDVGFKVGYMTFGIDSVLFTLFLYTVAVKYIHYSKKESKSFIYSSIVAVIISALVEFFALTIGKGYEFSNLQHMLGFFASAIATLVASFLVRIICDLLFKKNVSRFIALPVSITVANVVNSLIYFALAYFIFGSSLFLDFGSVLLGSFTMKLFATGIAELSYFFNGDKLWSVNELKIKNDENGPFQKDRD